MYFTITIGTIYLIIAGMLFLLIVRAICRNDVIEEQIGIIDKCVIISLFIHAIWAFIVDYLSHMGYQYLVMDDETYHKFAMGLIKYKELTDGNIYHLFLNLLYRIFGKTTANGRIANLFFSVATIYPLAIIEKRLNNETKYNGTRFYAFSPFIIFISFFEIKDICLTFLFISSYALVKKLTEKLSLIHIVLLLFICAVSEQIRDGAGVLPIAILVLSRIRLLGVNNNQRKVFGIISTIIVLGMAIYIGRDYLQYGNYRVEQYKRWIVNQFSSSSIYSKFVITKLTDIWKIPFCFLLYTLQPLDMLSGNMRFFSEFGMIAKFIDVPVLFFSVIFIPKYIKKEKWSSLFFIIMYVFTSCVNLTNARQGFFLYPIMYLIFFDSLLSIKENETNDEKVYLIKNEHNLKCGITVFSLLWFVFLLYRFIYRV